MVLQSATAILLPGATSVITKCDWYYKMRRVLLQSATDITKCDECYNKVRQILQSATLLQQSVTGITKCDVITTKCDGLVDQIWERYCNMFEDWGSQHS